jgi:MFS family permease
MSITDLKSPEKENVSHGLKQNWKQFTLLVIINAFVGGMVGIERSIFPEFAALFGVKSATAILSFITAFGLSKAAANYFTGKLANIYGRKNLLVFGWMLAIPIPFMLIYATQWSWVIVANVLLGLSQGLTWSSTVVMKIDLVGDKNRGLAMGINEFAGYFAVGVFALLSGTIAHKYGVTPYPFYLGIGISILGLLLSLFWVKDTQRFMQHESERSARAFEKVSVFWETTLKNKTLSAVTQAGLVNNLNDGMIWGLLPILLIGNGMDAGSMSVIAAIYPSIWGLSQLFTGKMSDHFSKRSMLFWGMLIQGIAIVALPLVGGFYEFAGLSVVLGLGTALVYPTFLSTIAQVAHPLQRAESIGTFRLWRDLGYAFGAIISGVTADYFGIDWAIYLIGILTVLSAVIVKVRMAKL